MPINPSQKKSAPARLTHPVRIIHHRVLATLWLIGALALGSLPVLTQAPNRLLSGQGVYLASVLDGSAWGLLLPALIWLWVCVRPLRQSHHVFVIFAATCWLGSLSGLAGIQALHFSTQSSPLARTTLGSAYWISVTLAWLAAMDASQRLHLNTINRVLVSIGLSLPVIWLLASGRLDQLSLLKEYANHRDVFDAALQRHLQIVFSTLLPTLVLGIPLGVFAQHSTRWQAVVFGVLNVIQTLPSIALFGLLLAPLAWLSATLPWLADWGIKGIGLAPAVIALTLYALLPMVRSTATGLAQVPTSIIDAAQGIGLSARQVFWRVRLPLALPVLLAGLRITTVQTIGLTVVAALIGAGGFGALMFQGLSGSALDLVLLGVIPVVLLAVTADALFKLLVALLEPHRHD